MVTVDEIKKQIDELFSDTSRPARETLDDLEELKGDIDMKIEAIEGDLKD